MRTVAFAAVLILAGCAAPQPVYYTKPGAQADDLMQAQAQCDYEVTAATQGTDYSYRTTFGQEFDRALRKRELMGKCLTAKGWRRTN